MTEIASGFYVNPETGECVEEKVFDETNGTLPDFLERGRFTVPISIRRELGSVLWLDRPDYGQEWARMATIQSYTDMKGRESEVKAIVLLKRVAAEWDVPLGLFKEMRYRTIKLVRHTNFRSISQPVALAVLTVTRERGFPLALRDVVARLALSAHLSHRTFFKYCQEASDVYRLTVSDAATHLTRQIGVLTITYPTFDWEEISQKAREILERRKHVGRTDVLACRCIVDALREMRVKLHQSDVCLTLKIKSISVRNQRLFEEGKR